MTNGQEAAFPVNGSMGEVVQPGLTKREYAAIMAMQGILARSFGENMVKDACAKAVEYADALLKALGEKHE